MFSIGDVLNGALVIQSLAVFIADICDVGQNPQAVTGSMANLDFKSFNHPLFIEPL